MKEMKIDKTRFEILVLLSSHLKTSVFHEWVCSNTFF